MQHLNRLLLRLLPMLVMGLGVGLLIVLRGREIRRIYGQVNGCPDCLDAAVALHDVRLLVPLLALVVLNGLWRSWALRLASIGMGALLVGLQALDIGLLMALSQRLIFADISKFVADIGTAVQMGASALGSLNVLGVAAGVLLAVAGLVWAIASAHARAAVPLAASLGLTAAVAHLLLPEPGYVMPESYQDLWTVNWPTELHKPFSEARANGLSRPQSSRCAGPRAAAVDSAILVIVESLSLYHSRLHSGLPGMMPRLDAMANRHARLEEFHANGFTTDGGLIALLTAEVPFAPTEGHGVFDWYALPPNRANSPIGRLHAAGVSTQYFSGADLAFLDTGGFIRRLGFQRVEGPEHPSYAGLPRGGFNNPGDHELYKHFLRWFDSERSARHFTVIQTVTTHPPFAVPGQGSAHDEAAAFAHADEALEVLVQQLRQRGFFEHGLLFITGDHRSMTPRRPGELERLGPGYVSRLPAVLLGGPSLPKGVVRGRWQQVDFMPSLLQAMGEAGCLDDSQGRFILDAEPPRVVLHARGAPRDQVMAWLMGDPSPGVLRLAGDRTAWVSRPADGVVADRVLDLVNFKRATRPAARP